MLGGCEQAERAIGCEVASTVIEHYRTRIPAGFWAASITFGSYGIAFSGDFDCVAFIDRTTHYRLDGLLRRIWLA